MQKQHRSSQKKVTYEKNKELFHQDNAPYDKSIKKMPKSTNYASNCLRTHQICSHRLLLVTRSLKILAGKRFESNHGFVLMLKINFSKRKLWKHLNNFIALPGCSVYKRSRILFSHVRQRKKNFNFKRQILC